MIIQNMSIDNIDKYIELIENFLVDINAIKKGLTYNLIDIREQILSELKLNSASVLMREVVSNDDIIGILITIASSSILNSNHVKINEFIWHTKNSIRKRNRVKAMKLMMNDLIGWAKIIGAKTIHISCPTDNDVHKFLCKNDFSIIEYNCIRKV